MRLFILDIEIRAITKLAISSTYIAFNIYALCFYYQPTLMLSSILKKLALFSEAILLLYVIYLIYAKNQSMIKCNDCISRRIETNIFSFVPACVAMTIYVFITNLILSKLEISLLSIDNLRMISLTILPFLLYFTINGVSIENKIIRFESICLCLLFITPFEKMWFVGIDNRGNDIIMEELSSYWLLPYRELAFVHALISLLFLIVLKQLVFGINQSKEKL